MQLDYKLNKLGDVFPLFNVVLYSPDIPGNTGSIGRTCLATNCRLILIHPLGFSLDEKAVRRAGLDYWKFLKIDQYQNWNHFIENEKLTTCNSYFFTKTAKKTIYHQKFSSGDYLIFGSETKGLPQDLMDQYIKQCTSFPMFSSHLRSINLSNIVSSSIYLGLGNLLSS